MVYLFAIIFLIQSFTLQSAQGESTTLFIEDQHPRYTFVPTVEQPPLLNVESQLNRIKGFLKNQNEKDFDEDKTVFNKHDAICWHGLTNKALIDHARAKLAQLQSPSTTRLPAPPTRADSSSTDTHNALAATPIGLYTQMLQDLIEAAQSSDQKQKKALRTKAAITGAGAATLFLLQCASTYFTNHLLT